MNDSRPDRLCEDGFPGPEVLDAWEVPRAAATSTDNILARAVPVLAELSTPTLLPESAPMLAPLSLSRIQTRSWLFPICFGLAVAAAVLLAFVLGRESAPMHDTGASLEVHVATPAPAAPAASTTPQPSATFPRQGVTRVFFVEDEVPPAPRMSTEQELPSDDAATLESPFPATPLSPLRGQ